MCDHCPMVKVEETLEEVRLNRDVWEKEARELREKLKQAEEKLKQARQLIGE